MDRKTALRKTGNTILILSVFILTVIYSSTSFAMTREEFLPKIFQILEYTLPDKNLTQTENDLTTMDAVRLSLEAMGWDFVITAYGRATLLPEWSEKDPLYEIASNMSPPLPKQLLDSFGKPFTEDKMPILREWIARCKKSVSWRASFKSDGTELILKKRGVGNPNSSANGDIEKGVNEPLYIAMLAVDIMQVPSQIISAVMIGSEKATLSTIANENYNVVGAINGGYFAGSKPIGILRTQGRMNNGKFWPKRSAFGWNKEGRAVFIDGEMTDDISKNRNYDIYTEILQAGPLLTKGGRAVENSEKLHESILNKRHPRTLVGTDGKRVYWAVIDGRNNMHSVGATIQETRKICLNLGLTTALNLDGGGSSSIWWRDFTFTSPSNKSEEERPIPYAILMFKPGTPVKD